MNKKQARAPVTQPFNKRAFNNEGRTSVRWLGNAGVFINSRGTCIMCDPILAGFDIPLLIDIPIVPEEVPHLDAVLITHSDNDHYDPVTNSRLNAAEYHAPHYVAGLMKDKGLYAVGHSIGNQFGVGEVQVALTPADHAWQSTRPDKFDRTFELEDFCGYWIDTPDGSIWIAGDSRLMEEQLHMPVPDVMFFDFSDNSWHIGLDNAVKLANTYPDTELILYHWGSVDAPEMDAFNADPKDLEGRIVNPERLHIVAPGEAFYL